MKIVSVLGVIILLLATGAATQDIKPISIHLGGGLSVPSSDFADQYDLGFHVVGGVGFNLFPMVQVVPQLEYHAFRIDREYWLARFQVQSPTVDEVDGGTLNAMMIGATIRIRPFSPFMPVKPFVLGGGGWANLSVTDFELYSEGTLLPLGTDSENKLFWAVGAGVEFGGGPLLSFFVQARYVSIQADDIDLYFVPVSIGVRF